MKPSEFKNLVQEVNQIMEEVEEKRDEILTKKRELFKKALKERDEKKIKQIKKEIESM